MRGLFYSIADDFTVITITEVANTLFSQGMPNVQVIDVSYVIWSECVVEKRLTV